jgi:hypothetical protein
LSGLIFMFWMTIRSVMDYRGTNKGSKPPPGNCIEEEVNTPSTKWQNKMSPFLKAVTAPALKLNPDWAAIEKALRGTNVRIHPLTAEYLAPKDASSIAAGGTWP